jgi:large subunit ribosomal protein L30
MATTLTVTLVKSIIGYPRDQRATVRSLGLRRLHHQVALPDTPVVRGMLGKVNHLLRVEEVVQPRRRRSARA